MTMRAAEALRRCDVIVGYTVYVELVKEHFANKRFLTTPMKKEIERCRLAFEEANKGYTVAMICSGDAGVYGMSGLMLEIGQEYPHVEVEVIPGAAAALDKVGLSDRMNFIPNQLSGGQKQRVAIARAIVNNPEILLADEPTGALDSKSSHQVMELFQKLNDEGVTVVMITHDSHVAQCAKRIVDIFDGEISERDRKEETL